MNSKIALSEDEKSTLEECFRNHPKAYYRLRAQCILLRAKGILVKDLKQIFSTRTHTIYSWIHRYKSKGFLGLRIESGRGVKSKMDTLDSSQIEIIKSEVGTNPQNLRSIAATVSEKFGFTITKLMLKAFLKKVKIHMA
jgi:transposase